ncbi:hypothetical protein JCM1840_000021 [Sporobolomyces johnsonii]
MLSLQPYDNAGFDVPHDILILASKGRRTYIPLTLLTRPAILDFIHGRRPALVDVDVEFEPLSLVPYANLEETMDVGTWSQAMVMMHLVLQQVMGDTSANKFGSWLHKHEHNICARLSDDAWPVLRRYDIAMRRLFWEQCRRFEALGRGFVMPQWEPNVYEAAAAFFGTKAADLDSLFKDGKSAFGKKLDGVAACFKLSNMSDAALSTVHFFRGTEVSPGLAAAIELTDRIKEAAKNEDVAKLHSSGRFLSGSAGFASSSATPAQPPPPPAPALPRPPSPTSHQQSLIEQQAQHIQQQAQLIRQQQQQIAVLQASQQQQHSYAQPGGVLPTGTSPSLHPSGRLALPKIVDSLNASNQLSGGGGSCSGPARRCAMCGVVNPEHFWRDCAGWDKEAVYRLGEGFAIRGTSRPVCANFNAHGCPKIDCTFVHGCTRCRFAPFDRATAHGHHECKATALLPLLEDRISIPAKRPAEAQLTKQYGHPL